VSRLEYVPPPLESAFFDLAANIAPERQIDRDLTEVERSELLHEIIAQYARKMNCALSQFRPLPGPGEDFFNSRRRIQLVVGSNRGGKTLHAVAKVAAIVTGHGEQYGFRARDGRAMACGKDWLHVSQVMWRKLFWPGQFNIIRDADTGLWRAVRVSASDSTQIDSLDAARMAEWKGAAGFLVPDEIEIAWAKCNLDMPQRIRHVPSGWELHFFSAEGSPRNGIDCDLVWFDEEIKREAWVPESLMRLVDRNGRMIWSFTPQESKPQAYEFHRRCVAGDETIGEYTFYIESNPYLPAEAKADLKKQLAPHELAVRWHAQYAITSRRVYPQFDPHGIHGFDAFPDGRGGASDTLPDDWMKLFFVDPGFQVCAVLFGAVPPKDHPAYPCLYLYDELYLRGSSCKMYGDELASRIGATTVEVAGIDYRYGRQSQATSGRPLVEHYIDEHRRHGISTTRSGHGFVWGSDNVEGRTDALHYLLDHKRLRVRRKGCFNLIREMGEEYYKRDSPDKRDMRHYGHLVACLEMMAGYFDASGGIYYNRPGKVERDTVHSPAYRKFRAKAKRRNERMRNERV